MSQPETYLQNQIVNALHRVGVVAHRHVGGRRSQLHMGLGTGAPDIIGWLRPAGRILALEVKMPGQHRTVTEAQLAWLESVRVDGGVSAVVTSVDEAMQVLRECGYLRSAA